MVDVRTGLNQQLQNLRVATERRLDQGGVAKCLQAETTPRIEPRVIPQ